MKKLLYIIFIFFFTIPPIFTISNNLENINISHYIGGAAGFSTGYGLSYRYWPNSYGSQVVFTPLWDGDNVTINIGIGGFKTIYETKWTRLFIFLASNGTYSNYYENIENLRIQNFSAVIGVGPGLEIFIFNNIALDIMFGYKFGTETSDFSGLGFTAECGLYYRF